MMWPCPASMTTVPGGTPNEQVFGIAAAAGASLPRLAVVGAPMPTLAQTGKLSIPSSASRIHMPAVPAIAAIGTAARDVFLPAEADASVSPRPPSRKMVTRSTNMVVVNSLRELTAAG